MLILTRKVGQEVMIGDGISITVLALHGNQVRLGISAPAQVPIFRKEVLGRLRRPTDVLSSADGSGTPHGSEKNSEVPLGQ